MTAPFSRIRLDIDEAELLYEILTEARKTLIAYKISVRDEDQDADKTEAARWELKTINRLTEETIRALQDLQGEENA